MGHLSGNRCLVKHWNLVTPLLHSTFQHLPELPWLFPFAHSPCYLPGRAMLPDVLFFFSAFVWDQPEETPQTHLRWLEWNIQVVVNVEEGRLHQLWVCFVQQKRNRDLAKASHYLDSQKSVTVLRKAFIPDNHEPWQNRRVSGKARRTTMSRKALARSSLLVEKDPWLFSALRTPPTMDK